MSENTQTKTAAKAAPKTRTAKDTSTSSPADNEVFAMNNMEVPAFLREMSEKTVDQARDAYTKMRSASEEASSAMEEAFEATRDGVLEINSKAIDAAKANTEAAFSHLQAMLGAKTVAEAIELQSAFARKQYDTISEQTKEIQEVSGKLASTVSQPVVEVVEKSFKQIRPS